MVPDSFKISCIFCIVKEVIFFFWDTKMMKNLQITLVQTNVTSLFLRIRGGIFFIDAEHDNLSK